MPFRKVGADDYVSPSGRHWTGQQVKLYHATSGFKKKPKKAREGSEDGLMFKTLSFQDILQEERLREYNQCHVPSGGANGGQFCATPGDAGGKKAGDNAGARRMDRIAGRHEAAGRTNAAAGFRRNAALSRAKQAAGKVLGVIDKATRDLPGVGDMLATLGVSSSDPANPYSAEYQAIGVPGFKPKTGLKRGPETQPTQAGFDFGPAAAPGRQGPVAGSTQLPGAKPKRVLDVSKKIIYSSEGHPDRVATYRELPINWQRPYQNSYYVDAPGFGQMHTARSVPALRKQIDRFHATGETPARHQKRKGSERYQKRKAGNQRREQVRQETRTRDIIRKLGYG